MSGRTAGFASGLLAALILIVPSALAGARPGLVEVGNVGFPDRAFVLTTPKPLGLDRGSVSVLENGLQIENLSVVPAQSAVKGKFGVVLVLDASLSMSGKPIQEAVKAARVFAAQRSLNEELGLVTFNRRAVVSLEPTANARSIGRALASSPTLVEGTHIYDAVASAIALLQKSKITVASVVLLSDGADTGSRLSPTAFAARARSAHIRVFTVGLHSGQFRASTLRQIAQTTGAAYSEASTPEALAPIYQALSQRLANEYLLQYRSPASPNKLVRVEARVSGLGTAVAVYRTPPLPGTYLPPYHRSLLDRFWLSPAAPAVVSLLAGLLVLLALSVLLRGGRYSLRQRMSDFVSMRQADDALQEEQQRRMGLALQALGRTLGRSSWWERFKEDVEIGEFPVPAERLTIWTASVSVFLAFLFGLLFPPVFIIFALALPPLVAVSIVKRKLAERRDKFAEQLPENLNVLASALRAGHTFVGALAVMVSETDEPSRSEFNRALSDEQLGVPVEDALVDVAHRMASGDLEQVALVAALQRQAGGNTAEVLDTVVDTIHERTELRRTVKTLTAQGRMARWLLTALPVALALFITLLNPHYMSPLYTTGTGQALLAIAIAMVIAGSLIIQRIVDVKV